MLPLNGKRVFLMIPCVFRSCLTDVFEKVLMRLFHKTLSLLLFTWLVINVCPSETVSRLCGEMPHVHEYQWLGCVDQRGQMKLFIKCWQFIVEDFLCYKTRVLVPSPPRRIKTLIRVNTLSIILTLSSEIYISIYNCCKEWQVLRGF